MWTRLVEIAARRCHDDVRPRAALGRGVIMLYGAMSNCREAFVQYKTDRSERHFGGFVVSIDALISTLHNLNPLLGIFDPRLADLLQDYALGEARVALGNRPHELVRLQIKILRTAIGASIDAETETLGEFDDALDMLTDLIQDQFGMEDLFIRHPLSTANSPTREASVVQRPR
jgi:hypothetical protein